MNLTKHFLTHNDCYKAGEKITVKGLMLHSTGANNPNLGRYIDDPALGNVSSSHWNQPEPGGRQVCVHGFIGKDKDGDVKTYQTLPWNHRGWHAGGKANDTHIGVEICEDNLKDPKYFKAVYKEAVELFAYLCKEFNLTEDDIITHSEGHRLDIASNHADVMHWFPKHGKSMDTFREDVKIVLNAVTSAQPEVKKDTPKPEPDATRGKSVDQLAHEVIEGKWGSGAERERRLGSMFDEVQERVNKLLAKSAPKPKTINQLADEVIAGLHGSGRERMLSLGVNYAKVQQEVNRRMRSK